ncbi:rhomboid family intramembrane serine protease [Clostridium sp. DJ247]|uniref:rhomboid family intramembrane serine protease n=1 Tax=Clostridium sp. DJ247 TaxID=2726188 RepID=UPI001623FB37|nr:rhomboid family intramembrane serine protease [Clostridium sp. DJ247]MBC2580191.1 rhomboid family intramembrane serine protease [Clostridium sp. DJ247]
MENYIRKLIEKLCELYGYSVVEFDDLEGLLSTWGVVKNVENTMEVIFFSDLQNYNKVNKGKLVDALAKAFQCDDVRLVHIVIDSELKVKNTEQGELCLNYEINPQCELILINNVDNKILYYSSGLQNKAHELANCMNYIKSKKGSNKKSQMPIITYGLIAVNVLIYILTAYLSGNISNSDIRVLVFLGAKVNQLIAQGQYYRLLTCMFLHGGIVHIALNMYSLYSIGPLVESVYGKFKYIIIYLLSGIVGSYFSYMFSKSISVGASGAIFGLLGATLIFGFKMKNRIGRDFITNILSVIGVNLIIGFSIANVDNFGHLGGLLGGIISSYLIFTFLKS